MRGWILSCIVVVGACTPATRSANIRWKSTRSTELGVSLETGHDWSVTAIDDAVLLAPTSERDDYAILVVRTGAGVDAPAILSRLGVSAPQLSPIAVAGKPATRVDSLQGGRAVAGPARTPVVVRIARLVDGNATTFVGAVIDPRVSQDGVAAFDRVLASVTLSARPAAATPAAYPAWLREPKGRQRLDDVDDDIDDSDDGDDIDDSDDEGD